MDVVINQDGFCKKSDNDIIWSALMGRCKQMERILEKRYLKPVERLTLQDEYERTFALTEKFRRNQ